MFSVLNSYHGNCLCTIDSGMVNEYIKKISGGDFTAKDFRTWAGTIRAFLAFKQLGGFDTDAEVFRKQLNIRSCAQMPDSKEHSNIVLA